MGLQIYDNARRAFAEKEISWSLDLMLCAIPRIGYVLSLTNDTSLSVVEPVRTEPVNVTARSLAPSGWLLCDTILFPAIPVNEGFDQVVVYRASDGLLIFNISFPEVLTPIAASMTLLRGLTKPGIARL